MPLCSTIFLSFPPLLLPHFRFSYCSYGFCSIGMFLTSAPSFHSLFPPCFKVPFFLFVFQFIPFLNPYYHPGFLFFASFHSSITTFLISFLSSFFIIYSLICSPFPSISFFVPYFPASLLLLTFCSYFLPYIFNTFVLLFHPSFFLYLYLPLTTVCLCGFRSEVRRSHMTSELKQNCLLASPLIC